MLKQAFTFYQSEMGWYLFKSVFPVFNYLFMFGTGVLLVTMEPNNTSPEETIRTLTGTAVASYQLNMNSRKHSAMSKDCKFYPHLHTVCLLLKSGSFKRVLEV